ncbi:hypothetical protein PPROV_001108200 [Pycnococcus provasolii]|uniref:ABC transporter domain-containing protein n=1 Tax=Pycnococcus provasolii TaxID=41880 RepID=A0A830HZ19_9CHLO|nr:hypothetical protein PPROV_001108200 [Pycnococcus provasolii]
MSHLKKKSGAAGAFAVGLTVTLDRVSLAIDQPGTSRMMTCPTFMKKAKIQKPKRLLLNNVSLSFYPFRLAAILGPSGSGKTTLLDVVSRRKNFGTISGSVRFSNVKPTPQLLKREVAYVEQQDNLLPSLTVCEMLLYTAALLGINKCDAHARVDALLRTLDLYACRDVKVGSVLQRGISGGQAKRVNIALALVSEPRVLLLDEPTSGLDSSTSLDVIAALRRLADGGTTIISTIHSPSRDAFALFDDIVLLAPGGILAYYGPISEATTYFRTEAAHLCGDNASNDDNSDRGSFSEGKRCGGAVLFSKKNSFASLANINKDGDVENDDVMLAERLLEIVVGAASCTVKKHTAEGNSSSSNNNSNDNSSIQEEECSSSGSIIDSTMDEEEEGGMAVRSALGCAWLNSEACKRRAFIGALRTSQLPKTHKERVDMYGKKTANHLTNADHLMTRNSHDDGDDDGEESDAAAAAVTADGNAEQVAVVVGGGAHNAKKQPMMFDSPRDVLTRDCSTLSFATISAEVSASSSNTLMNGDGDEESGEVMSHKKNRNLLRLKKSKARKVWAWLRPRRHEHTCGLTSFAALLRYRTPANLRDLKWVTSRLGGLVFGVVIATLYVGVAGSLQPKPIMDTTALLFMLAILPAYAAAGYMPSLIEERPLFYRERNDGLYAVWSYLAYKFVEEMIIAVPVSILFSVMVYYAAAMSGSVFYMIMCMLATTMTGVQLAYLVAALAPTMNAANTILPLTVTIMLFFTGLLRSVSDMPIYWRWFADVSFVRYTWNGLMLNQFGPGGTTPENPTWLPTDKGSGVLDFFELSAASTPGKWMQFLYVSLFGIAFLLLTWLSMSHVRHTTR